VNIPISNIATLMINSADPEATDPEIKGGELKWERKQNANNAVMIMNFVTSGMPGEPE
jgi:hypothetical protein